MGPGRRSRSPPRRRRPESAADAAHARLLLARPRPQPVVTVASRWSTQQRLAATFLGPAIPMRGTKRQRRRPRSLLPLLIPFAAPLLRRLREEERSRCGSGEEEGCGWLDSIGEEEKRGLGRRGDAGIGCPVI
jgi:hypothetical protein